MNVDEKIEELSMYENFHVGDHFIIVSKPNSWNSLACKECPFRYKSKKGSKISYPYKGKIEKIIKKVEIFSDHYPTTFTSIGMTEGKYGWSLDSLIWDGVIIHDVKEQRKAKLNKIKCNK